jgi:hypothetical protein
LIKCFRAIEGFTIPEEWLKTEAHELNQDEEKIKDLYNRLALGGTAHTAEQIAV